MLDQLRQQRRELLDRYDLGGVYDDIARQLDEVVDQEREGIDRRVDEAAPVGRPAPRGAARTSSRSSAARSSTQLPPDLAGRVQELQQYDWMDDAARQRFEELMEELRSSCSTTCSTSCPQGMSQMSPEQIAAHEGHARRAQPDARADASAGEEPDFDGLHGALRRLLPGQPADARRAARADGAARWPRCSRCSTR